MDSARQILRFSIPGSIFLLWGTICFLLYRRIQGVAFVEASNAIQDNVAAVIAVAATIPVGFLIYQLYYFNYAPVLSPWFRPWGGRFVRKDRGGEILLKLDDDQLEDLETLFNCRIDREPIHSVVQKEESPLKKLMYSSGVLEVAGSIKELPMENKERQKTYEDRWYTHWDVLRSAMDFAASTNEHLKSEYTTLSDIYHSLGAARTAVMTAWLGISLLALSHVGRIEDNPVEAALGLLAIFVITTATYAVLHVARGRTWRTAEASLIFGLRWVLKQRPQGV